MAGHRPFLRVAVLVTALTGIVAGFLLIIRPTYLNWGSTATERSQRLPGDEIVPHAGGQTTRAITIRAPIEDAWPWLAQLGQDRGGFYSFDLLENAVGCQMPTVDVLRARHQVRQLGDKLWMYPSDRAASGSRPCASISPDASSDSRLERSVDDTSPREGARGRAADRSRAWRGTRRLAGASSCPARIRSGPYA